MRYISTRGRAPALEFEDVLLTGLASDGGLYVPETWPQLSTDDIAALRGASYGDVALALIEPFVDGTFSRAELKTMIDEAYATFTHAAITPIRQLSENHWLLELFHGPTLAFKDIAMQLLARLMDGVLARRGCRATIIGATSGDTGGAAIEAFGGRDSVDIFILHPYGRVSDVQRRQMTTVRAANIHNIAIEGNFDDCQTMAKTMFGDTQFHRKMALASVNSINWARIMAQTVYYFTSAIALGSPDRPVRYCVPSGNLGNLYAGYVARRMGLPIEQLIIATNANDILARIVKTGRYEMADVVETTSPSMDIRISSNFERLLFDVHERDANEVNHLMSGLKQSGAFTIKGANLQALQAQCAAGTANEDGVAGTINTILTETGQLLDPHTAVGVHVARQFVDKSCSPLVTLSTAHPAKFPAAIKKISGQNPALPEHLSTLHEREERLTILPNDPAAVQAYIAQNAGNEAGEAI